MTLGGDFNSGTFDDAAGITEQWIADRFEGRAVSVTDRAHRGNWAAVSGSAGGKVLRARRKTLR